MEPSAISAEPTDPGASCRLPAVPVTSPPKVELIVRSSLAFTSPVLLIWLPAIPIPGPAVYVVPVGSVTVLPLTVQTADVSDAKLTGKPDDGPMRVGIPIADLCSGHFCAQAIMAALLEREVTGEGQWVQTSLLESQIAMLDFQAAQWLIDGKVPRSTGNEHPLTVPTGVFQTQDGYINLAAIGSIDAIEEKSAPSAPRPVSSPPQEGPAARPR